MAGRVLHNGGAFYLCRAGADCLTAQIVVARVAVDGPSVFFGARVASQRSPIPQAGRRIVRKTRERMQHKKANHRIEVTFLSSANR